jgi:hypothetical protein
VSRFEHVNFVNNGKYSKKHYDNSNYYASFVIFQTYKNIILNLGELIKKIKNYMSINIRCNILVVG